MTTKAQLRKGATALPEVEESTVNGLRVYKVDGKVFAALTNDGSVDLTLSSDTAAKLLAKFPAAELETRANENTGLRIALNDVNGMELNSLVYQAWLSQAPAELAAEQREAARGEAPPGDDALPRSIGKPATRALLAAGIKNMTDVAARSEAELAALHGVGPKALRLLAEALAQRVTK